MQFNELLDKHLTRCGISMSKGSRNPINVRNFTYLIVTIMSASSTGISIRTTDQFDERIDMANQSTSFTAIGICYIIVVSKTSNLFELIENLTEVIRSKPEHPLSDLLYTENTQRVAKWLKILDFAGLKITPLLATLPRLITCFLKYYLTDLGNSAFELPMPTWLPFDTQSPIGFSAGIIFQYIVVLNTMVVFKSLMVFGFATCSMLFTLTEDLKNNLKTVNDNAKRRENRSKIPKQFSRIVQFHCNLIRLTHEYSRLAKEMFILTFSWGLGAACAIMLLFKMKMDTINSTEIINLSIAMVYSIGLIGCICEFGEQLGRTFDEINDVYDEFQWYLFPCKAKHILSYLMIVAQRSVELRVFGSISCGRITFKSIINTAYSWFMVLRRFEN